MKLSLCMQEEALKEHADSARRRKEAAEAAATPEERVAMYAARKDEAKNLQKREVRVCSHMPAFCRRMSQMVAAAEHPLSF